MLERLSILITILRTTRETRTWKVSDPFAEGDTRWIYALNILEAIAFRNGTLSDFINIPRIGIPVRLVSYFHSQLINRSNVRSFFK